MKLSEMGIAFDGFINMYGGGNKCSYLPLRIIIKKVLFAIEVYIILLLTPRTPNFDK